MGNDNSEIFVDDDWKRKAQEEKKKLAEQVEKKKESAETTKPEGLDSPHTEQTETPTTESPQGKIPPASFETLVSVFASQAMVALGMVKLPEGKTTVNLDSAKFNIDMLGIIEEKTKGNLTPEEKKLLDQTLHQLRLTFVQVASAQPGPVSPIT